MESEKEKNGINFQFLLFRSSFINDDGCNDPVLYDYYSRTVKRDTLFKYVIQVMKDLSPLSLSLSMFLVVCSQRKSEKRAAAAGQMLNTIFLWTCCCYGNEK